MITDIHRVQALNIFMDDANIKKLDRKDIIAGINSILKQKTLYPESKELVKIATKKINEIRGTK